MAALIDADGHIIEPPVIWESYAEPAYRDRVIQVRRSPEGGGELWIEGERRRAFGRGAPDSRPIRDPRRVHPQFPPGGGSDPAVRLRVLDEEGIDQALLFPTYYLGCGDIQNPEVAAATCRAYNDWIADFCRHEPERLFGVGLVPLQSVEYAVQETRRIAELGLRAALIRPERFNGLPLYDDACSRFWATAQDCDLAVALHGGFLSRMPGFAVSRYENLFFDHMVCHPFEQMAACLDIVCGGVLDRFPGLRVGFFESGVGWLPYWLRRMDEHFETMQHHTPWLKRRPSEAFREQCFVSMDTGEGPLLAEVGSLECGGCVLWGSDYPHFDCVYPGAWTQLEEGAATAPAELLQAVMHDNPRRFMGLP